MKSIFFKRNMLATHSIIMMVFAYSLITLSVFSAEAGIHRNFFLLLDSRIVENVENANIVLGTVQKHEANPLFIEDKPWEKRFDNFMET